MRSVIVALCIAAAPLALNARQAGHTFALGAHDFLLDGNPFQIVSGELHPARIPREYWAHRIRMAKALGCNAVAAYIFWNYHEREQGVFDFSTGNRDIAAFIRLVQAEGMYVLLRPGPYVCAEWDFGGLPPYLLRIPDIKVRCSDPRYMAAVDRYVTHLAAVVRPLLVTHGGPVLMVQIENEYGSYGNDRAYLEALRAMWTRAGIDVPFYTADGANAPMLEAGNIDGAAIGLDSGTNDGDFLEAARRNPAVPTFSSETYPGWLTHWGEQWARPDTAALYAGVRYLLSHGKSFNFYVVHGGTNFGFTAGANSGGRGYEPHVTSYDYDAPVNEQGRPTAKFFRLRELIGAGRGPLPPVPDPVPAMEIPRFAMNEYSTLWANLPAPVHSVQPQPMEAYGQYQGLILYRTTLLGRKSGTLTLTDLHDYALVFVDGSFVGALDRRLGENTIVLPPSRSRMPVLEILVEAMGRINYGPALIDRKGITERVTLDGMTLMNWDVFNLPMDEAYIASLREAPADSSRRCAFFRGSCVLDEPADTFLDLSGYEKGIVWVNGHNLGRYWNIGPQQRLYCPGPWLRKGKNEVIVFDLRVSGPVPVRGLRTLEGPAGEEGK
ncbi:MAG TPA: beta-galactosidase family protein [Bacteroidota bacterium]|nr:beta-galactosidase family protein [Bacteroidota bacterium]